MHELLTSMSTGITRGLSYLKQHQFPNGEFCSYIAADAPMKRWCIPDTAVFPSILIANSLLFLSDYPEVEEILKKTAQFLEYQMQRGGVWHHFTNRHPLRKIAPLDVDDTVCASSFFRERKMNIPAPTNIPLLLANTNKHGLFYSWIILRPRPNRNLTYWRLVLPELLRPVQSFLFWRKMECERSDVDAVVNANVLYYLGDTEQTQPVIHYLLKIIAENKEEDCDKWYRNIFSVYYFLSRNYYKDIHKLEPARQPVIERILSRAKPDGRIGENVLDTALAVCALLNWKHKAPEMEKAVRFILNAQANSGEWERWLLYYGGPKLLQGWGSEEMTTGYCLEALARYYKECLSSG